jgi:hypothetical protein
MAAIGLSELFLSGSAGGEAATPFRSGWLGWFPPPTLPAQGLSLVAAAAKVRSAAAALFFLCSLSCWLPSLSDNLAGKEASADKAGAGAAAACVAACHPSSIAVVLGFVLLLLPTVHPCSSDVAGSAAAGIVDIVVDAADSNAAEANAADATVVAVAGGIQSMVFVVSARAARAFNRVIEPSPSAARLASLSSSKFIEVDACALLKRGAAPRQAVVCCLFWGGVESPLALRFLASRLSQ